MLNTKFILENIIYIQNNFKKRNILFNKNYFIYLYHKKNQIEKNLNVLYQKRNIQSTLYIKNSKKIINNYKQFKEKIIHTKKKLKNLINEFDTFISKLSNLTHHTIVHKNDLILKIYKVVKKNENIIPFKKKSYLELLTPNTIDFEIAGKIAGKKFTILKNNIATLHRILCQYMLNIHVIKHKYQEMYVPFILNSLSFKNSGHLPKFSNDLFKIENKNLWLNPTGEVPLINLMGNKILKEEELPLKLVCHTTCFRKEAGNYGSVTSGFIRQHQFEKIELVQFCKNTTSYDNLNLVLKHAESILKKLQIPYRLIQLNAANISFTSSKTIDIEAWFPGLKKYIEVSSCSNTETFQSLNLHSFFKNKKQLVHIINGSGLAVGRTLLAIIENYQNNDGIVKVPKNFKKLTKMTHITL